CDFPVCLCHIITATAAAAISRFINEPGFLAALMAKLDDNETEGANWVGQRHVNTGRPLARRVGIYHRDARYRHS
ncbi:hypothetical protein, partial [Pectobacterium odoriferum]|uniref:hypothetical protein n=1 Tax=Pectobacterium odoriferum TaxID=78398 RepID=UPI0021565788